MKYGDEFVKKVTDSVISGSCSIREVKRIFGISRDTVSNWVNRTLLGLPARFRRAAKKVKNKPDSPLLDKLKELLSQGKNAVSAWIETNKKISLRSVFRWKSKWFPKPKVKRQFKRYERRKALSLMHTDWAQKRILGGEKIKFTFHVDDATRMVFGLRAYNKADQLNTADALRNAIVETGGFRSVLTDCGKVYTKAWGELCSNVGTKPIHTRPYNPQCNGKAEAVVKKVKAFLNKHVVEDIGHANKLLSQYEKECNNTPHSSLKYQTPQEVYRAKQRDGLVWAVS